MGQWCDRHWSRIRDDRTINGLAASILLMRYLIEDERFIHACGGNADAAVMNEKMAEVSPICCFLGEVKVDEIIAEATIPAGVG